MKESNDNNSQYDIVIVQCCENCETHQNFARHSEWKYFEQFNELKRKIERFINNTIVIKNPIPDELIKTPQIKTEKNLFINKNNNEKIIFPRIGAFEIYIYNILISSKLMTNQWPNHYKILQTLAKMIEQKKKGNNIDHYSVYFNTVNDNQSIIEIAKQIGKQEPSPEKKNHRIISKKKKLGNTSTALASKAYKSIQKGNQTLKEVKMTLEPISNKVIPQQNPLPIPIRTKKAVSRYLESKAENRIKLPALSNTVTLRQQINKQSSKSKSKFNSISEDKEVNQAKEAKEAKEVKEVKKVQQTKQIKQIKTVKQVNKEKELKKQQISVILNRNVSQMTEGQKISLLELKDDQSNKSISIINHNESLKFLQDRSIQYSQPDDGKQLMNRSIQYEEEEGFMCDFGLQADDHIIKAKDLNFQFVQTQIIELVNPNTKPYMLDENVQANIIIKIPKDDGETQTIIKQYEDENICTDAINLVNRGLQFPQQKAKQLNQGQLVDSNFQHLYQKRRNMTDNEHYSIDRFEQKATKYKWIGRWDISQQPEQTKRKIFLECLVFSVYNYYGIKTPQRRLSYQLCSNVVGQKVRDGALHIMTFDNPELQYLSQFEECNRELEKYPLSELITFRASKQIIKFTNYGGLLALAYLLNDYDVFSQINKIGLVIVNQAVKQIHKLSALNYQIHSNIKTKEGQITVDFNGPLTLKLDRLSQAVQLQFFSMLSRITDQLAFDQLIKQIREIFIHASSSYQQFKLTILSLHLQKLDTEMVEDFISMLTDKVQKLREMYKGKLYTYVKYHTLTPIIKYSIPFELKVERRLRYKQKVVAVSDVIKHIRTKGHIVIVEAEDGMGKTTLLNEMAKQLQADKVNVVQFSWLQKEKNRIKDDLFQITKNVIFVDNLESSQIEVIELIDRYRKTNFDVSYCIATCKSKQGNILRNHFAQMTIVETELLPLTVEQIKNYLMKVVKNQSFTTKKELSEKLVEKKKYIKILQIPFYLSLYSSYLSSINCQNLIISDKDITKYTILKQHFSQCTTTHSIQIKAMNIHIKDALPCLRRLAFEYYHNGKETNEILKDILTTYQQNELIRSQMVYYPINLDSPISSNYQPLFNHNLFLNYFLIEAYSYFVEKAYRSMKMEQLYNNPALMELTTQRYKTEQTHSQLIEVVISSKKMKNIAEASSNALTLLCRMGYVFSNVNFDDCIIPTADLSSAIFYQCSFRGADLEQAVLYKSQMISCVFDNAIMNRINLYSRKYQIEFTAMTASLSVDSRKLAFGCGNYLIVVNAQTGLELKRIEAHLDVIRMVRYSRDGNSLITVADDKTLRIWDVYTFKSVVFKLPQKGSINYSNETDTIASVNKNILKVWNLKSMANESELQGHNDTITIVEFSYDGQFILTGSKDASLRLWTLRGKQKMVYKSHQGEIITAKLSPTNRIMISSGIDKTLIMWQTQTGTKIQSKLFHTEIPEICLDNRQKYIVCTFNNDNHIFVLDFATFDVIHSLNGHKAKIISLNFNHGYSQLVSLGKDRTARIWDFDQIMSIERRNFKTQIAVSKGQVLALAYDKVQFKFATSYQNGEINIWNAEDCKLIDQVNSHSGAVKCLAYDKASKLYSGGSDGSIRVWNLQIRRQPRTIEAHSSEIIQLKLSERSRIIVTTSLANELVLHDFTGIKVIMSTRQEGRLNAVQFSHDEKRLAVGGAEKYIAMYDIHNETVTRADELGPHSDPINVLCFFGDSLLVCGLKNGQVAIWNHIKATMIKKIENVSPIRAVVHFQRKYICFSSEDGKIRIINMDEGREIRVFRYSQFPTAIDTNQDESLLYVATNLGNIIKWNLNCVQPPKKKIEFDRKAIDADCSRIVTVQSGNTLLVRQLLYHRQELVQVRTDSMIEGVTFDSDKMIVLLKNGKYWQVGKREYKFTNENRYQGDLFFIRDKNFTNFYRSGLKKVKGMSKPTQAILEEVNA